MRGLLAALVITTCCTPVLGATGEASKTIKLGDTTYHLHAGSDDECETALLTDGSTEVTCKDGTDVAILNSRHGCLDSSGDGYCGKDVPYRPELSGSQLNCPDGASYFLSSGVLLDNDCSFKGETKVCRTSDGEQYAEATCRDGCGNTRRTGVCCNIGTRGCPYVPRKH